MVNMRRAPGRLWRSDPILQDQVVAEQIRNALSTQIGCDSNGGTLIRSATHVRVTMRSIIRQRKNTHVHWLKIELSEAYKEEFAKALETDDVNAAIKVILQGYDPDFADMIVITGLKSLTIEPK